MSEFTERRWFIELRGRRFGFEASRVGFGATPYLDRYIVYLWPFTLRLHKFWRGDDDRAPHCHPFWFVTFPFKTYVERVYEPFGPTVTREVKAHRFHFRPATFRHIVLGVALHDPDTSEYLGYGYGGHMKPFWTFVISSQRLRKWGFWPRDGKFVPYDQWEAYCAGLDKSQW